MTVRQYAWAWAVDVDPLAKYVLLNLVERCNSAGQCWPSVASIASATGLSRTTVLARLAALERAGLIHRERRHRADGTRSSDQITLCLSPRDEPRTRSATRKPRSASRTTRSARRTAKNPVLNPVLNPVPTSSVTRARAHDTAQTLVAEWIEHCEHRPPNRVIGQVGKHIRELLAEGINADHVRRGLVAWTCKGLHPATLPSVVNEVMNARPRSTTDERVARTLALGADMAARRNQSRNGTVPRLPGGSP